MRERKFTLYEAQGLENDLAQEDELFQMLSDMQARQEPKERIFAEAKRVFDELADSTKTQLYRRALDWADEKGLSVLTVVYGYFYKKFLEVLKSEAMTAELMSSLVLGNSFERALPKTGNIDGEELVVEKLGADFRRLYRTGPRDPERAKTFYVRGALRIIDRCINSKEFFNAVCDLATDYYLDRESGWQRARPEGGFGFNLIRKGFMDAAGAIASLPTSKEVIQTVIDTVWNSENLEKLEKQAKKVAQE